MTITVSAVLKRGRELIANGFTQGKYARDANGYPADLLGSSAACFCTLGALRRAKAELLAGSWASTELPFVSDTAVYEELACLYPDIAAPYTTAMQFNDGHTKEEVLAKFDAAIARGC